MEFGKWLQREVDRLGISMAEFSRQLGVSQAAVSRWVHGQNRPDVGSAIKIANVLGLDANVVFSKTGHAVEPTNRLESLRAKLVTLSADRESINHQLDALRRQKDEIDLQIEKVEEETRKIESFSGRGLMNPLGQGTLLDLYSISDAFPEEIRMQLLNEWTAEQTQAFVEGLQVGMQNPDLLPSSKFRR